MVTVLYSYRSDFEAFMRIETSQAPEVLGEFDSSNSAISQVDRMRSALPAVIAGAVGLPNFIVNVW